MANNKHSKAPRNTCPPKRAPKTPVEKVPVEEPVVETPSVETSDVISTPVQPEPAPVGKMSALDAAAKVLAETREAMNTKELIGAMAAKGYWTSPGGKTPASTLYAAILRELNVKGDKARFRKAARGRFVLADHPG